MKKATKGKRSNVTLVVTVLILVGIIFFARQQNIVSQNSAPAYQNHQDLGVKAFKVNEASKI